MKLSCIKTGDYRTNTYIIEENGNAIVVDPGAESEKIVDFLNSENCVIKYILITHGHFDHIGAVADLQKNGAKVYVPKIDYEILKSSNFYFGMGDIPVEPFDADVMVNDGDKFELLGHKFTVLSTPGHTLGGVCYIMDNSSIFSGDTLFRLTVGRTDLPYSDPDKMLQSLKKLFSLPGNYDVYPGHERATDLDFERKYNPHAKF